MTHAYLSDIGEADLKREIMDAKDRIEQIVGHPIEHFSCPGGRYNERTLGMARSAGFKTVANSEFHANTPGTNPYELGRVAMLRGLPIEAFSDIATVADYGRSACPIKPAAARSGCLAIEGTIDFAPSCSENLADNVTKVTSMFFVFNQSPSHQRQSQVA